MSSEDIVSAIKRNKQFDEVKDRIVDTIRTSVWMSFSFVLENPNKPKWAMFVSYCLFWGFFSCIKNRVDLSSLLVGMCLMFCSYWIGLDWLKISLHTIDRLWMDLLKSMAMPPNFKLIWSNIFSSIFYIFSSVLFFYWYFRVFFFFLIIANKKRACHSRKTYP